MAEFTGERVIPGQVDPDLLDAIGLGARQPFYTRDLPLLWGRLLPDGTILFGRELLPLGAAIWADTSLTLSPSDKPATLRNVLTGERLTVAPLQSERRLP